MRLGARAVFAALLAAAAANLVDNPGCEEAALGAWTGDGGACTTGARASGEYGFDMTSGTVSQTLDLSGRAAAIDEGLKEFNLTCALRGSVNCFALVFCTQAPSRCELIFRDEAGATLVEARAEHTGSFETFTVLETAPVGARSLEVRLRGDNDGATFVDDVVLLENAVCGDGVISPSEECDGGDDCLEDCTLVAGVGTNAAGGGGGGGGSSNSADEGGKAAGAALGTLFAVGLLAGGGYYAVKKSGKSLSFDMSKLTGGETKAGRGNTASAAEMGVSTYQAPSLGAGAAAGAAAATPSRKDVAAELFAAEDKGAIAITHALVPTIVAACTKHLEETSLDLQGLFRESGSASEVSKLKNDFADGTAPDLGTVKDAHVVAGALKLYLRELPEPVVSARVHGALALAADVDDDEEKVQRIRAILHHLPEVSQAVLGTMSCFLAKVAQHKKTNKMTAANLAVVFGPTLLRGMGSAVSSDLVQTFVQQAGELFV